MDGNARWAKKKKISRKEGYKKGIDKIKELSEICLDNKIKFLTVFALSSENIKRSNVNIIFDIISNHLDSFLEYVIKTNKIRIRIFGNKNQLSEKINKIINKIEITTKENNELFLNVALNYGSIDELIYCFNNLINNKNKRIININEKIIRNNFYLQNVPDPDLLIRTGGFQRLSNFLLFQLSYTELFFTKTLWPDITKREIINIFNKFKLVERKYGL